VDKTLSFSKEFGCTYKQLSQILHVLQSKFNFIATKSDPIQGIQSSHYVISFINSIFDFHILYGCLFSYIYKMTRSSYLWAE
jgi:hypothetical protein